MARMQFKLKGNVMEVPVELKIKYLDRRRVDINHLLSSLAENDFDLAIKLGHQIKGNAATFEFPRIGPIGSDIENAAKNGDKEQIRILIQKMASEIKISSQTFH